MLEEKKKSKVATGAKGGDWGREGVEIGWGIWKDCSPCSVFSFFGSFFRRGDEGFSLRSPQSD